MEKSKHIPVLLNEVLDLLELSQGDFAIDGTAGDGGHSIELAKRVSPGGVFLGIDWDSARVKALKERFDKEDFDLKGLELRQANYKDLPSLIEENDLGLANGFLLDLGFSSDQLEGGKGFSFRGRKEKLSMTYSEKETPLYEALHYINEKDLMSIIKDLSDERYARQIASAIVSARYDQPIVTNRQLADVVKSAVPRDYEKGRIHPATRTFMALRMYINRELENLGTVLGSLERIVAPGGRVAIISYHSKEDLMVKEGFGQLEESGKGTVVTKNSITPTEKEVENNPRSRSAKLRVIEINDHNQTK
ncbi:MAG: ribosomal RNA small subunit methyltransferase H [Candidatus Colwellbacteria bacterium CG10_big_fil_rev_8_21_14_0_10_41_28]|uniref:Ribosomal RNA small subunit methyltransferase H n=1 Tax=Candidatus Colwellbacteria bacterium CG10_big_fil_rev_8_21_14_0_10_41_28 TaxID=1974539 RepID=A0A2H0VHG3_9BACT|nr:MAG: ribosomal RNA small subunit methyltransferase H [Candidatus Colwellbacteria bacterium CG10_big_fil_rev_8_21_14_0_10_41_28]